MSRHQIRKLENPVQNYAWGSYSAIPELLGQAAPADSPWAELWLGAHPKAPSQALTDNGRESLDQMIAVQPESILGPAVAARFDNQLPFLFKILAAAQPLSIQAHPDKEQAAAGFERENKAGLPLTAPQRNYRDPNPKPECLCALTPFAALCGFRPVSDILADLSQIQSRTLSDVAAPLSINSPETGLRPFFENLLTLPPAVRKTLLTEADLTAQTLAPSEARWDWLRRLNRAYPEDAGVLAPLFLNLIALSPGQALFLPAGVLHAYLEGTGLELMANSDNVLRGGLTGKHVAVQELLQVLDFSSRRPPVIDPVDSPQACEKIYPCPAEAFVLSVITVKPGRDCHCTTDETVQILLNLGGSATIREKSGAVVPLEKGQAVLVPAAADAYQLSGEAVIYKATVPPVSAA